MVYERLQERVCDVLFTTTTPFTEDGEEIDRTGLTRNLEFMYDEGGRVFVACGNSGEYFALSDAERASVVGVHVEALPDDAVVIGGAGGSLKEVVALASKYSELGADGLMVMHPSFPHIHCTGLTEYYTKIAEHTDLGILIYKQGPEVPDSVVSQLTETKNIVGIKYAVNDIKAFASLVNNSPADVTWINGIAERFAPSFHLEGAGGYTTGIGNFAPAETLTLFDALSRGDFTLAKRHRDRFRPFEDLREESGPSNHLPSANNVPAVKHGLDLRGLAGGVCRPPLTSLSDDDQARAAEGIESILAVD